MRRQRTQAPERDRLRLLPDKIDLHQMVFLLRNHVVARHRIVDAFTQARQLQPPVSAVASLYLRCCSLGWVGRCHPAGSVGRSVTVPLSVMRSRLDVLCPVVTACRGRTSRRGRPRRSNVCSDSRQTRSGSLARSPRLQLVGGRACKRRLPRLPSASRPGGREAVGGACRRRRAARAHRDGAAGARRIRSARVVLLVLVFEFGPGDAGGPSARPALRSRRRPAPPGAEDEEDAGAHAGSASFVGLSARPRWGGGALFPRRRKGDPARPERLTVTGSPSGLSRQRRGAKRSALYGELTWRAQFSSVAEVPTTKSATSVISRPASARPAMIPISHAFPAAPPPPRTRATL